MKNIINEENLEISSGPDEFILIVEDKKCQEKKNMVVSKERKNRVRNIRVRNKKVKRNYAMLSQWTQF